MGIFFSKSKRTAEAYVKSRERKEFTKYSKPKLSKVQRKHIIGWKTWEYHKIDDVGMGFKEVNTFRKALKKGEW